MFGLNIQNSANLIFFLSSEQPVQEAESSLLIPSWRERVISSGTPSFLILLNEVGGVCFFWHHQAGGACLFTSASGRQSLDFVAVRLGRNYPSDITWEAIKGILKGSEEVYFDTAHRQADNAIMNHSGHLTNVRRLTEENKLEWILSSIFTEASCFQKDQTESWRNWNMGCSFIVMETAGDSQVLPVWQWWCHRKRLMMCKNFTEWWSV